MIDSYSLVLATDLDGTFLGGSDQQRSEFYQWIEAHRDRILLIFVTGRSLELVKQLENSSIKVPQPDYIIGDVGTTIFNGDTLTPVAAVQDWVAERWGNANKIVKALVGDDPGLVLQPIEPDYRVSYYYHEEQLQPSTLHKLEAAGFDYILSGNKFLDVMPKGVAKGSTLLKLLEILKIDLDRVLTCGDTLNDLSLFTSGLQGVAVGNSEPKLAEKVQTMPNVHYSAEPGVMGIWDAIKIYNKPKYLLT